jgi:HSP20 family protein
MTLPMRRGRYSSRRWDPFAGLVPFDDLFDQMSRMLTNAFPDVARISVHSWSPPVDIQETEDAYLVEADLPGVRPDDVTIDLQGKDLRIGGEYGTTEQGEGEQQQARRTGRFDYRLTLPGEVHSESCAANLENGVLRLRLPKVSTGTRQRIPVQTGRADQSRADQSGAGEATAGQSNAGQSNAGQSNADQPSAPAQQSGTS